MQAARQRVWYEASFASIQKCDLHRMVQLNNLTRVYYEMPHAVSSSIPVTPPADKKKDGRITYTTAVADTGEKKEVVRLHRAASENDGRQRVESGCL